MLDRAKTRVREIIGRISQNTFWMAVRSTHQSVDKTKIDYKFWDNFRRAKNKGYEFGALFARPIAQTVATWVMGGGIQAMLAEKSLSDSETDPVNYTNDLLKRFSHRIRGLLLSFLEDDYSLADMYVVVNADGSLSVPSPDTVDYQYDEMDYRSPVKAVITTRLQTMTVTDEYRSDGRTLSIKRGNAQPEVVEFENLLGELNVIHFPNERGVNETHGRTIYEPLLPLFGRYDDLLQKALDAGELTGNPIPTFEGMEDVDETINANADPNDEEYIDEDSGEQRGRVRILFDRLTAVFVGRGGSFNFKSPQRGFTEDIRGLLKVLFLLILDYTRIPEVIWGNELSSSRASAGEQIKSFFMYISGRRLAFEGEGADDVLKYEAKGGLLQLFDIWLKTRRLTDPKVMVAPVTIRWPELSEMETEWQFKWTEWAQRVGILTDEEALAQSNLVEDPEAEVEKANTQNQAKRDQFERAVDEDLAADDPADDEEEVPEAA